ncbi:MAG: hypothetical protein ACKOUM_11685, partial [Sphingopyxis sp.]
MAYSKRISTACLMASGAALCAAFAAQPALAQTVSDDAPPPQISPLGGWADAQDDGADAGPAPFSRRESRARGRGERGERGGNARGAPRTRVDTAAYIEVGQVVTGEFSGNRDVLTYSTVAVGAQAAVSTRRAQ